MLNSELFHHVVVQYFLVRSNSERSAFAFDYEQPLHFPDCVHEQFEVPNHKENLCSFFQEPIDMALTLASFADDRHLDDDAVLDHSLPLVP